LRQQIGIHEKVKRLKFYQLENGSMIPLSDIRFTRYSEPTSYSPKDRWDVVLKSGPQFVISQNDFNCINEILKYESEEVDRLMVYGRPIWQSPGADWGQPEMPIKVRDELIDTLSKMTFPLPPMPSIDYGDGTDRVEADENIKDDEMEVKGFDMIKTEQSIADMFSSMVEELAEDVKTGASLDTYSKPKSYPQRRY
jgi:hypothetical protein